MDLISEREKLFYLFYILGLEHYMCPFQVLTVLSFSQLSVSVQENYNRFTSLERMKTVKILYWVIH